MARAGGGGFRSGTSKQLAQPDLEDHPSGTFGSGDIPSRKARPEALGPRSL